MGYRIIVIALVASMCLAAGIKKASSAIRHFSHDHHVVLLDWEDGHSDRAKWSAKLRGDIYSHIADFNKADWSKYCKKFDSLSNIDRVEVIATMAVAIAYFESSYDPTVAGPDVGNTESIGLFQLSYEDNMKWCAMDSKLGNLIDPIVNIDCAIGEMSFLISKDNIVAFGGSSEFHEHMASGLARYWSTTWDDSRGKLNQIRLRTNSLNICN